MRMFGHHSAILFLILYSISFSANLEPRAPDDLSVGNSDVRLFFFEEFSWSGSDPDVTDTALVYRIQIDDNSNFASPLLQMDGLTDTQIFLSDFSGYASKLKTGVEYYWRVRAKDPGGLISDYASSGIGYTYVSGTNMLDIPAVPTLSHVVKDSLDTLYWEPALYYDTRYTVSLFQSNGSLIHQLVLTPTTTDSSMFCEAYMCLPIKQLAGDSLLNPGTFYYWEVLATSNSLGQLSGAISNDHYFLLSDSTQGTVSDKASAWIIGYDSTEIYTPDSLFVIQIPDSAFSVDSVGVIVREVVLVDSTNDSVNMALKTTVHQANSSLTSVRTRSSVGQKVFAVNAVDLRTGIEIQPKTTATIEMQFVIVSTVEDGTLPTDSSTFSYNDTILNLANSTVFQLDTGRAEWAEQQTTISSLNNYSGSGVLSNVQQPGVYGYASHTTNHLSVYSVLLKKGSVESFGDFLVYPSPIILSENEESKNNAHISYFLNGPAEVAVRIYSRTGKLVWKVDLRDVNPNEGLKNEIIWDGTNLEGNSVGNGYYIVKLSAKVHGIETEFKEKQIISVVK